MASLVSSAIILTISFIWARHIVKIIIYKDRFLKIMIALASVLPLIYIVKIIYTNLFLAFVLSLVILLTGYFIILMLLKTFREDDIALVRTVFGETKLSAAIIKTLQKCIS
jgi:hypothetical protein